VSQEGEQPSGKAAPACLVDLNFLLVMSNNIKYLICLNLGPADGPIKVDIIRKAHGRFPELAAVHVRDRSCDRSAKHVSLRSPESIPAE
jgi:hypothetical protein